MSKTKGDASLDGGDHHLNRAHERHNSQVADEEMRNQGTTRTEKKKTARSLRREHVHQGTCNSVGADTGEAADVRGHRVSRGRAQHKIVLSSPVCVLMSASCGLLPARSVRLSVQAALSAELRWEHASNSHSLRQRVMIHNYEIEELCRSIRPQWWSCFWRAACQRSAGRGKALRHSCSADLHVVITRLLWQGFFGLSRPTREKARRMFSSSLAPANR